MNPLKIKNTALSISEMLLSVTLLWASWMKLSQSPDELAVQWPWVAAYPNLVKFTGFVDLLASLGFTLPSILHRGKKWKFYAAMGLIALMLSAIIFHISRGEAGVIGINILILLLAAFVAWGSAKSENFV
ncbi:DoxX family protein [Marinilongibacter aquaticus]|uniref:DoxX family protein n=1 Tax=Marinilongibacter aquaticus TaxID=2975157 RepID=UPI0021BDC83F|nr:DoxX family protein [Marinilongibacter aquaticus]UBM59401.1 DoxX family protein [Marinilongibacter aquaticus]